MLKKIPLFQYFYLQRRFQLLEKKSHLLFQDIEDCLKEKQEKEAKCLLPLINDTLLIAQSFQQKAQKQRPFGKSFSWEKKLQMWIEILTNYQKRLNLIPKVSMTFEERRAS